MFVIIGVYFGVIVFIQDNQIAIITSFISFISAMIIVPTKIIEYLFNPQETEQISAIIKNIQDYDKVVREDLSKKI